MINNALQALVTQRLGEDAWLRLAAAAGVEDGIFLSLETYPDEVTYALAGSSAKALGLTVEAFLVDFGRFWITYALDTSYGSLLRAQTSLSEALIGLDDMHRRIQRMLSMASLPTFRFSPSPTGGTLRYISSRAGLALFVFGLLQGLAQLHGTPLSVKHTVPRTPETNFDEFELEFKL